MSAKTFGQLIDELTALLETQGIPDRWEGSRAPSDPGDKFDVMTQETIWFAGTSDEGVKKAISGSTGRKVERNFSRSMLEVLWQEGEAGLERIKQIIGGGCRR